MKTILLPTDFSDNAKTAIDYAISMLKDEHCYYILLNTYERPRTGQSMLKSIIDILRNDSKRGLKKELKRIKDKFDIKNIEVISEEGGFIAIINSIIAKRKIDLVFVGSKGESNIEDIIIGSNTARVIKYIDFPSMIIPVNEDFKKPKTILFPTDLKEITNEDIVSPLLYIAKKYNAEIKVLYVDRGKKEYDKQDLENRISKMLEGANISFNYIENSDIPEGINKFLEDNPADFLAMIKRKGRLFDNLFHQSLTKRIALNARYPLLALHD